MICLWCQPRSYFKFDLKISLAKYQMLYSFEHSSPKDPFKLLVDAFSNELLD